LRSLPRIIFFFTYHHNMLWDQYDLTLLPVFLSIRMKNHTCPLNVSGKGRNTALPGNTPDRCMDPGNKRILYDGMDFDVIRTDERQSPIHI
jgi:hypothetical protein